MAFMAAEETPVKTQSNLPTSQQPISHHRPQVTLTQKSYPHKCQLDPIKKKKTHNLQKFCQHHLLHHLKVPFEKMPDTIFSNT